MKQSILFGNGLNLIANNSFEWKKLLMNLNWLTNCNTIPYTIIYEKFLCSSFLEKEIAFSEYERIIKNEFIEALESLSKEKILFTLYEDLFKIGADFYLTTNYDTFFTNGLIRNNYELKDNHQSELAYNMRRWSRWGSSSHKNDILIWTIHGTICHPKTMMLGFDHYCGSIMRIGNYLKSGKSNTKMHNKDYESYCRVIKQRKLLNIKEEYTYINYRIDNPPITNDYLYWIDFFFISDVHIIGFGLNFNEIDIWWLLNKRKRLLQSGKSIKNKIYVYGYVEKAVYDVLVSFDVDVSNCVTEIPSNSKEWEKLYKYGMSKMNNIINK